MHVSTDFCRAQASEGERLAALHDLQVLDTAPEQAFDQLTQFAAQQFGTPIAIISLVAADRQWFKSRVGLAACGTDRDISFCSRAILADDPVFIVPDATQHPDFCDNPLVQGAPNIRFYAGAPLVLSSGHKVGTLAIIDHQPRSGMTEVEQRLLQFLASQVVAHLELRRLREFGLVSSLIDQTTSDAFICVDAEGRITHWNRAAEAMFGWAAREAIGRNLEIIVPERLRAAHGAGLRQLASGGRAKLLGQTVEVPGVHRDGHELPLELSLAMWHRPGESGSVGFAAIIRDASDRKRLEAEKNRTQAFLDTVVENIPAMLFVKDGTTREYLLLNRAGEEAVGLSRDDVLGKTDHELFPGDAAGFVARDSEVLRTGLVSHHESSFRRADGQTRVLHTRRVAAEDPHGQRLILGITEDVTDRRSAQARIDYLAYHDELTGLANRTGLGEQLERALQKQGGNVAVLCMDLDRFKAVNDLYGHAAGDQLLVEVGKRLRGCTDKGATIARLGGDEFAMILERTCAAEIASTAGNIIQVLSEPFNLNGCIARIGTSIGAAVAPNDGHGAVELLGKADLALYRAKDRGRGTMCFFEAEMDRRAKEQRQLELALRSGIAAGEVVLDYQPLACLESGRIDGFEALARWHHPTLGLIPPDVFVPIAEDTGLIVELGRHVLRTAIAEASTWAPPLRVAVNLSPLQFLHGDLAEEVAQFLREFRLEPGRLELEITEGLLIRDADRALHILKALRSTGVRISMDDFGTGYSSLSYFRQFPFDKVKIDRSFVRDMGSNPQALAIVQAVIGLGRGLGMPVVAEGVESEEQLDALRSEGCTLAQGFLIGEPAPIESFNRVVFTRNEVNAVPGPAFARLTASSAR